MDTIRNQLGTFLNELWKLWKKTIINLVVDMPFPRFNLEHFENSSELKKKTEYCMTKCAVKQLWL